MSEEVEGRGRRADDEGQGGRRRAMADSRRRKERSFYSFLVIPLTDMRMFQIQISLVKIIEQLNWNFEQSWLKPVSRIISGCSVTFAMW